MTGKKRDVWQSSEYFNELGKKDKIRYKEKPSLSNELGKKDKIRYKEKPSLSDGTTVTDPCGL